MKRSSVPSNRKTRSPSAAWYSRRTVIVTSGSDGLGEGDEAAQVAEDDRDLATVTLKEGLVARRDDQVGDLRREESLQPTHAVDLSDLFLDPVFELSVPLGELGRLLPNGVVILLDSDQRTHAREQLSLIERLHHEVVGSSLERLHASPRRCSP